MQLKLKAKLLTLAILLTFTFACKKDRPVNQNKQLIGSWTETPIDAQFQRTYFFGQDGSFTLHSRYIDRFSQSASTLNGTYSVNGNQLLINITEEMSKTQGLPPTNAKVSYVYLDKATFNVTANRLTLNYTSYPLDAPVATQVVLVKN